MTQGKSLRRMLSKARWDEISTLIQNPAYSLGERAALRFRLFLEEETAILLPDDPIPAWRTIAEFPDIYAPGEKEARAEGFYVHERGRVSNLASDWEGVLQGGLLPRREKAAPDTRAAIDATIAYADRFSLPGLSRAIRFGPETFLEALQTLRILHFCLWIGNTYHNTVGRFDQYAFPYFERDLALGRLTEADAFRLVAQFLLSFNRDNDLYPSIRGNNGQSLMLGGCRRDGSDGFNALSVLCIKASLHNKCIDPKINIRVNSQTPLEVYELCTELTKAGLGFPQYANDDVVIPALCAWGYDLEDARDYTVAACWEFIIPGAAMDIPNIGAISHAGLVKDTIDKYLMASETFEELMTHVRDAELEAAQALSGTFAPLLIEPAPYQTALMKDYTRDISLGARYNNYGIHGTGFSTATDQLVAVKQLVFERREIGKEALLSALQDNFRHAPALRTKLLGAGKLGRDDCANAVLDDLIRMFADAWKDKRNERGGIFRVGTGTAMYYLSHAEHLGATADGRYAGEPLAANFTPSLLLKDSGPLSVVEAMARKTLPLVSNGGPLTMEFDANAFRNDEGIRKVAQLVRHFIRLGGHQLQLNAISRADLLDAVSHPEKHQTLIVRVWGFSACFVELEKSYQAQILSRTAYR